MNIVKDGHPFIFAFAIITFAVGYWGSLIWAVVPAVLMLFFIFSCAGILFGNLNALAMEPLGHLAGLGASVVGSFSMFISIGIAILIGQTYNQTLYPLSLGFFLSACAVSGLMAFVAFHPAPINQHP